MDEFRPFPAVSINSLRQIVEPALQQSYWLLGFQKTWIDDGTDNVTQNFTQELLKDPIWFPPPGQLEHVRFHAQTATLRGWLIESGASLIDAQRISIPDFQGMYADPDSPETSAASEEFLGTVAVLRRTFLELPPERRAGVVFLHNRLDGALVAALALASDGCTSHQFAETVLGAHGLNVHMPDVVKDELPAAAKECIEMADAATAYAKAYRAGSPIERLLSLIKTGEASDVEFKSTLRFDLKEQKNNRAMTDAVVKTVAAFINTSGGTLLIGVGDDGTPIGLTPDKFESEDAYLRHLYTVLTNAMGPSVAPLVNAQIMDHQGHRIAVVECCRAEEPFTVHKKNGESLFYVRVGPATASLNDHERIEWIRRNWPR